MIGLMKEKWWIWLLRGIAAIIFGTLALLMPGITLEVLVLFLAVFLLVDGAFNIFASLNHSKETKYWWLLLLEGIVSVLIGIITLIWPQITVIALLFLIVFWAMVNGFFRILAALQLRKYTKGEWFLIFSGIFSLIFGVLLLIWPDKGLLVLIWMLGFYAFIFGILLISFAFKARKLQNNL
jgi:uncharacterized membrane protein HdeD (DUF308 family)